MKYYWKIILTNRAGLLVEKPAHGLKGEREVYIGSVNLTNILRHFVVNNNLKLELKDL